ncbi:UDP-N-acetylmuramoyl-L-alanine--D-glutamate ligase [bacterium]|nr:UDP-N-acetylmuramoyl-L-alanine--D-glutamate ligase [bacterium]
MKEKLREHLSGKRILLLGYGREGASSLALLRDMKVPPHQIGVADLRLSPIPDPKDDIEEEITRHTGEHYLDALAEYDIVLKSPGIPLSQALWKQERERLTSQIELFLKYFEGETIGITGTKGKTTTSQLLFSLLSAGEQRVHLAGNIGIPIFSMLDAIQNEDLVILELSSHQLHHIRSSPTCSLFLNLYEEHLEYYGSFKEYQAAKCQILQGRGRAFINETLQELGGEQLGSREITWLSKEDALHLDYQLPPQLAAPYHRMNALFALRVAEERGIPRKLISERLQRFTLAPHRIEEVGSRNGVRFINDSAATIPKATIGALEAFPHTATLIVGGFDRGIDLTPLRDHLLQEENLQVICIPDTGDQLHRELTARSPSPTRFHHCPDLKTAVALAHKITPPGTTCLFSPAAASYHLYRNYEERGDHFRDLLEQPSPENQ